MFIYTVKASRLKFFALLLCSVAVLLVLYAVLPKTPALDTTVGNYSYTHAETNDDRIAFLSSLGYAVESSPSEVTKTVVPNTFDSVYEKYNEIQKSQGLNLSPYKGKTLTRYTYKINNYPADNSKAVANLLIYNGKIVGGDVCSVDGEGFLHGFEKEQDA